MARIYTQRFGKIGDCLIEVLLMKARTAAQKEIVCIEGIDLDRGRCIANRCVMLGEFDTGRCSLVIQVRGRLALDNFAIVRNGTCPVSILYMDMNPKTVGRYVVGL